MLGEENKKRKRTKVRIFKCNTQCFVFVKYLKELCGNLSNPPCPEESEEAILPPH